MNRNAFPAPPAGTVLKGWGFPYALIKRGGTTPGKRPATALAYIIAARSNDGGRSIQMRALIKRGDGWSKPRPLSFADVVAYWRNPPRPETLNAARKRLDKAER